MCTPKMLSIALAERVWRKKKERSKRKRGEKERREKSPNVGIEPATSYSTADVTNIDLPPPGLIDYMRADSAIGFFFKNLFEGVKISLT